MWAFSDESERANRMIIAVVLVPPTTVHDARAALRGLLLPGQRRIHTTDESPRRRRALLDVVTRIDGLEVVALSYRRRLGTDHVEARRALLGAATHLVVERSVAAWTLDDQDPPQRARDRDTIGRTLASLAADSVVYDHRRSHTEPGLWAADLAAWAVGAGGHWRRRINVITEVREISP